MQNIRIRFIVTRPTLAWKGVSIGVVSQVRVLGVTGSKDDAGGQSFGHVLERDSPDERYDRNRPLGIEWVDGYGSAIEKVYADNQPRYQPIPDGVAGGSSGLSGSEFPASNRWYTGGERSFRPSG